MNALAVGIANAIAAQAATSRLLFSMSRDRQLPAFLYKINRRAIPQNALLLVSGLTPGAGAVPRRQARPDQHEFRIDNTHGQPGFDRDAEPVVRVTAGAGDRIALETSDEAYRQLGGRRDLAAVTATINPVTGPVYVDGAEPGDALAVTLHEIRLTDSGWSIYLPGVGALAGPMGTEMFVRRVPVGWPRTCSAGGDVGRP